MITITFNGDKRETAEGLTVAGFVKSLGLEAGRVAVEKNTLVIRKKNWDVEQIEDGDTIEVVTFVGGGAYAEAHKAPNQSEARFGAVYCSTDLLICCSEKASAL